MGTEPDVMEFATTEDLWRWLADHHETHPGGWVRLQRSKSNHPSVSFHDLLEAGIAFGWSESTRRANDRTTYLQHRAGMMQAWADYLDKLAKGADVIQFKAA